MLFIERMPSEQRQILTLRYMLCNRGSCGGRVGALVYRGQARVVRARRFQLLSTGPVR